jgi:uncharacterized phage protein gp47/JayE
MALTTPTISEIAENTIADLESEYGQSVPLLSKAFFRIWARIRAAVVITLWKYSIDAYKQRFAQTANRQYLMYIGHQRGIDIDLASAWTGTGSVVCTEGGQIKAGTQAINNSTGVVYTVQTNTSITLPATIIPLKAASSGSAGNLNVGDTIALVSPPPGVGKSVVITAVTTQGEDEQDIESYRQEVLDRYRKQPQGGALCDYELWAKDAPHVLAAYPYTGVTPGTIKVYIEVDNQPDGIPTEDQLADALDAINLDPKTRKATRRPATAEVSTESITRTGIIVTVVNLYPDTDATRALIEAAATTVVQKKEPFIQSVSQKRDDTLTDSEVTTDVVTVAREVGAMVNDIRLYEDDILFDVRTLGEGEKLKILSFEYI